MHEGELMEGIVTIAILGAATVTSILFSLLVAWLFLKLFVAALMKSPSPNQKPPAG